MPERFQESILHGVFGVGVVLRDMFRQTKYFAFIPVHQFLKCSSIPGFRRGNKSSFVIANDG